VIKRVFEGGAGVIKGGRVDRSREKSGLAGVVVDFGEGGEEFGGDVISGVMATCIFKAGGVYMGGGSSGEKFGGVNEICQKRQTALLLMRRSSVWSEHFAVAQQGDVKAP